MKIVIIGVVPFSLINFRGDLIREFIRQGYEVVAMANGASQDEIAELSILGVKYIDYPVARVGLNPLSDLWTLYRLGRCFSNEAPDYILSYTIKPVIYGAIAAKFFPNIRFFGMITGLGLALGGQSLFRLGLRSIILKMYRFALKNAAAVIFQNSGDRKFFIQNKIIPGDKSFVVDGSGVNLKRFEFRRVPAPDRQFRFLMVARLLKEKGVLDFLEAAERIRATHEGVDFLLIGPEDASPNAVPMEIIEDYQRRGVVRYGGEVGDIREPLCSCNAFVLPTYYGEGVPRTILEALAIGRAVITTNTPGCRETVINGKNGFLVNPRDSKGLADKMLLLMDAGAKIDEMGLESRKLAEGRFDVELVNKDILKIIQLKSHVMST